mgnify:FL=1
MVHIYFLNLNQRWVFRMGDFVGIYHTDLTAVSGNHAYQLMKKLESKTLENMIFWQRNHIFLGWTAPTKNRIEPCYDEEKHLAIVAQINLSNRNNLLEQLTQSPLSLRGANDTQLILEAYQKWGKQAPNYLEGDFSFIIWDVKNEELFGARDSNGVFPFYYFYSEMRFAFSNHLTPLFALPYVEKKLQDRWFEVNMDDSLESNEGLDSMLTPYKDVMQLPPGYAVLIHNNEIEIDRFCKRRSVFH